VRWETSIVAVAVVAVSQLHAVPATGGPTLGTAAGVVQQSGLDAFPLGDREELPDLYQDWLRDVEAIITEDELDVFLRCPSDTQRELFIEHFWKQRDPSPGTPRNEYVELYYERLAYVNKHFGASAPGSGARTDQGRMYLVLGAPMNVKQLPSTRLAYPVELWFYHADPKLGIPPFFNVVFFKELGMGEYRLYSPVNDGPIALLNYNGEMRVEEMQSQLDPNTGFANSQAVYNVLITVDPELADAAMSLIPGNTRMAIEMRSLASDLMLANVEKVPEVIMPNARWAWPILTGSIEAEVRFDALAMAAVAAAFVDPSGIPFVHVGIRADGAQLNVAQYEDEYYVTFEIAGSLSDAQRRVVTDLGGIGAGAKLIKADLEAEQALRLRTAPMIYLDRLPAVEGQFHMELVMENKVSRAFGHTEFEVSVPSPRTEQLRSSDAVLILDYSQSDSYDAFGDHYPFQLGRLSLLPAIDQPFASGGELHVFHQVYLPVDQTEVVETRYRLENDAGIVVEERAGIGPQQGDDHGTVNLVATLELADVAAGDYRLFVDVVGDDRAAVILPVRVEEYVAEENAAAQLPMVQAESKAPPTDPLVGYIRARQYRALGQEEDAIATLAPVLARAPEFAEALALQLELLIGAGHYEEVNRLLAPRLFENPNNLELLATLAEVNTNLGNHYDAIRYFERARIVGGEDTPDLLNKLGAEYFADGQVEKARELLEQSLQLQPQQPEIRRLLEAIR